jgi:hypothetical protein
LLLFFPLWLGASARQAREEKRDFGLGGQVPRAVAPTFATLRRGRSAALPWASIFLPLRGAGMANSRTSQRLKPPQFPVEPGYDATDDPHWYLRKFPLSPRGTSGERAGERGINKTRLLTPTLSSFLRQEEREKGSAIGHFSTCVDTNALAERAAEAPSLPTARSARANFPDEPYLRLCCLKKATIFPGASLG